MVLQDKKQILILASAAVITVGFIVLRYIPLHKRLKTTKAELFQQQQILSKAETESKQLEVLAEQLQELKDQVGNFEVSVPSEREIGVFLHEVATLMNERDLREQQIQHGQETSAGGLNGIPVNIKCKGSLEQIFGFFRSLQSQNRSIRIEQVQLMNTHEFSGELSMEASAIIFYRSS
ncbi:MAG: type 4a pilus biogenesis protein PilO [Planctomycetota bacterium]|jgi:Tfp pilus assembly protein PilO